MHAHDVRHWLISILLGGTPVAAVAQAIPFSQHATASQRVGVTEFLVEYNRPTARGRVLFGPMGVVRPDRVWNPGADSASRITLSRDVEIEGRAVRAGRYTIWLLPREATTWVLIISRAVEVYHTPYPGDSLDVLRAEVVPETGAHMDALAFYFPVMAPDSAILRIHWGTTIIPIRFRAPARE